jgi:hypothetical protein
MDMPIMKRANHGGHPMNKHFSTLARYGAFLACISGLASSAWAASLLDGFGGDYGYGELAMLPNDDGSSSQLDLPFSLNFFGSSYDKFYINNNGNITFEAPLGEYTPSPFPISNQPIIAPWWADVDTRGGVGSVPSNAVYVAAPNADTVVVTWHNVGYYPTKTDKLNNFQLVLRNRADTGTGNFDFDFRYQRLEWTTGDASGGSGGLGGVPAQAGFDDGKGAHYQTLPGSLTGDILNVVNLSNVGADTPGLWTFAVRNGTTPGSDPSNPQLPVIVDGNFQFDFNVQLNQRVWLDPAVAIGYDFAVGAGSPSFASLIIRDPIGDNIYELYLWNGSSFYDSGTRLAAGEDYTFAAGTRRFSIRGIEVSAGLDPTDPTAFVVGLTFDAAGAVSLTQSPLAVPELGTNAMLLLGLTLIAGAARRRDVI